MMESDYTEDDKVQKEQKKEESKPQNTERKDSKAASSAKGKKSKDDEDYDGSGEELTVLINDNPKDAISPTEYKVHF
jgi:hypothetical protein